MKRIELTEQFIAKMSPQDRKMLGVTSNSDHRLADYLRNERQAQNMFARWLTINEIYYIQPRADIRSTVRIGHPDFSIFHKGKTLFIEMKAEGGTLSESQIECAETLRQRGFTVQVCYSALEAIEATREFFSI